MIRDSTSFFHHGCIEKHSRNRSILTRLDVYEEGFILWDMWLKYTVMKRVWELSSTSLSKFSITKGFKTSHLMRIRVVRSQKRFFNGKTPAKTSKLIVWVECMQPKPIRKQRYCNRFSLIKWVFAAERKQKHRYLSTDNIVVRCLSTDVSASDPLQTPTLSS